MMKPALFFCLLLFSITSMAETVYVKDELRVGVRTQANSNEAPIAVIKTGAALEVLEHDGGYMRVRTEEGVEGWINQLYASDEKPARLLNEELTEANQQLSEKIRQMEQAQAPQLEMNAQLEKALAVLQDENGRLLNELNTSRNVPEETKSQLWIFYMVAMLLLFVGGIYLGIKWHRDRVAQRLGGIEL